jgi:hypothetical protein
LHIFGQIWRECGQFLRELRAGGRRWSFPGPKGGTWGTQFPYPRTRATRRIPGLDGDLGCGRLILVGYCTVRVTVFVAVIVLDVPVTVMV